MVIDIIITGITDIIITGITLERSFLGKGPLPHIVRGGPSLRRRFRPVSKEEATNRGGMGGKP